MVKKSNVADNYKNFIMSRNLISLKSTKNLNQLGGLGNQYATMNDKVTNLDLKHSGINSEMPPSRASRSILHTLASASMRKLDESPPPVTKTLSLGKTLQKGDTSLPKIDEEEKHFEMKMTPK